MNPSDLYEQLIEKKKSILVPPEYKRGSSKATIQWKESVKERQLEERIRLDKKNKLHALSQFMSRGSKSSSIQDFLLKLRAEEDKMLGKGSEESLQGSSQGRFEGFFRGLLHSDLQKTAVKGVDLTQNQQVNLELLKHKIKQENDEYLKKHPELDVLLSLVFRKLLKTKPKDPKGFIAHYVHYLNIHREELFLNEMDVPFDRPPKKEEEPKEDLTINERFEIEQFAKELVQKCAEIASRGSAFAAATGIIESMLESVDKSENSSVSSLSLRSAEETARDVLMSMLTCVAKARTRSAEVIVEEVLDSVLETVCPSLKRGSQDFSEVKETVDTFVRSLLRSVVGKAAKVVTMRERQNKFEKSASGEDMSKGENDILSITSRSILKKAQAGIVTSEQKLSEHEQPELKSKVKFKSMSFNTNNTFEKSILEQ